MAIPKLGVYVVSISVFVLLTAVLFNLAHVHPFNLFHSAYRAMTSTSQPHVHIAIIGAGSAGLAALKQIVDAFARPNSPKLHIVVYESHDEVGGVWLCDESVDKASVRASRRGKEGDQLWVYPRADDDPSPMYPGLYTNLPNELMAFRDLKFPKDIPMFPNRAIVQQYLEDYATTFDLRRHVRFRTRVERLRLSNDQPIDAGVPHASSSTTRRWTIESRSLEDGKRAEESFDYVVVANGHYADGWIPQVPGLASFPGQVLHSRFYRRPDEFRGKTVLVVGSFASGSDLSRQLASLNLDTNATALPTPNPTPPLEGEAEEAKPEGYTKVYVSASTPSPLYASEGEPWNAHITAVPLISSFSPPSAASPKGSIHFADHDPIDDVDVVIYATGYNFALPFCKAADRPWSDQRVLDGEIVAEERTDGWAGEAGGLKGLAMKGLDELMLFLDGDRTIAFPALEYQVVPFPLAEAQARLIALLWANLLPSFPAHPSLPPNPSNPYWTPPPTPKDTSESATPDGGAPEEVSTLATATTTAQEGDSGKPPVRKVISLRQKLVFGAPYEWTYSDYLMSLMYEADGEATPEVWQRVEQWRRDLRELQSGGLRKRVLGY